MGLKLKLLAIVLLLIFIFPIRARACGQESIARFETQGNISRLTYEDLFFTGEFTTRERAWVIFYNLLCMGRSEFVPQGVELLGVTLVQGELVVNVSSHIKNYGGTYNEEHLHAQLVLSGLGICGVDAVTLLIDGEPGVLPEGMTINQASFLPSFNASPAPRTSVAVPIRTSSSETPL